MNTQKIWQVSQSGLHPLIEAFTVKDDYLLDQKLIPYDIQASLAHAEMLNDIGVLNSDELKQLKDGFNAILENWKEGKFIIKKEHEDGHTAIETYLTEHYGEVGKKIHTGRSRNDQSLVMLRLFMKDSVVKIQKSLRNLVDSFTNQSSAYKDIEMPGYTHMQKAMPTTVGTWLQSFGNAFKDISPLLESTLKMIDQNPLGSASGFGISNFEFNRKLTTKKLDFSKVQENPMYCGLSRGHFELITLNALVPIMVLAGRFASDMLLFTTSEFGFFSLSDELTTGSSIMPQKKNYDLFEVMRAQTKTFSAYQMQIQNIISGIGSGYQRDLQFTKKPFIEGVELCTMTLEILILALGHLKVHPDRLKAAMTEDLWVTHSVYDLVNKGHSFREAYKKIKRSWQKENSK